MLVGSWGKVCTIVDILEIDIYMGFSYDDLYTKAYTYPMSGFHRKRRSSLGETRLQPTTWSTYIGQNSNTNSHVRP